MFQVLKLFPSFLDFLVHSIVDNRGAHCPCGCVAVLYGEKKHARMITFSFCSCSQVDVNPTLTDRARLVQRSARVRQKEAQPRWRRRVHRAPDCQQYLQAVLWEKVKAVGALWLRLCSQRRFRPADHQWQDYARGEHLLIIISAPKWPICLDVWVAHSLTMDFLTGSLSLSLHSFCMSSFIDTRPLSSVKNWGHCIYCLCIISQSS